MRTGRLPHIIALFILLCIAAWASPGAISLYYEIEGGRLLSEPFNRTAKSTAASFCETALPSDESVRASISEAVTHLKTSLYFNPQNSQSDLLLGRAYCLLGQSEMAIEAFREYTRSRPANPLGHLELFFAYEVRCHEWQIAGEPTSSSNYLCPDQATQAAILAEWQAAGLTSQDMVAVGDQSRTAKSYDQALAWYKRAAGAEPGNKSIWAEIGKLCQDSIRDRETCELAAAHNPGGMFVSADFASSEPLDSWHTNGGHEAKYNIAECPDVPGRKCAHVSSSGKAQVGFFQCMHLEPGRQYDYSAWLKAQIDIGSKWRPLYVGGRMQGKDEAYWLGSGYETRSADWSNLQFKFTAPDFDEGIACFYPVLLEGAGQVWFHSAKLR